MNPRTVFQILEDSAARYGKAIALYQPVHNGDQRKYQTYTWREYRDAALEIAAGLRTIGIRKGDIVALDSETRAEFYLSDIGIMANGSIAGTRRLPPNTPANSGRFACSGSRSISSAAAGLKLTRYGGAANGVGFSLA